MKTIHSKALAIFSSCAMACAATLQAQEIVLPTSRAEAQKGKFLCWAAASMTARNIVKDKEGSASGLISPSQWKLSLYNVAHDERMAFGPSPPFNITALKTSDIRPANTTVLAARKATLDSLKTGICKSTALFYGQCDHPGDPILMDLDFEDSPEGQPLGFCALRALMTAGRPVVFEWQALKAAVNAAGQSTGPEGDHSMVVVGTRILAGIPEVRIWDPWPNVGAPVQRDHLQWIPYTEYAQPAIDQGVPGEKHGIDRFQIRRHGSTKTVLPATCEVTIPAVEPFDPTSLQLDLVQREFLPGNLPHTLPPNQLPPLAQGHRFGLALPIVALTSAQIVRAAGDPERVRGHEASSVLLTVEDAKGHADTFFSLVHDRAGWHRGGYVNNGVARQLAEMRTEHWEKEREARPASLADYYMLSIPSRRTFFVAYVDPRAHETMFVPVTDDPAIGAVAGKSRRARDLLLRMATDIEADWARQSRLKSAANDHGTRPAGAINH